MKDVLLNVMEDLKMFHKNKLLLFLPPPLGRLKVLKILLYKIPSSLKNYLSLKINMTYWTEQYSKFIKVSNNWSQILKQNKKK